MTLCGTSTRRIPAALPWHQTPEYLDDRIQEVFGDLFSDAIDETEAVMRLEEAGCSRWSAEEKADRWLGREPRDRRPLPARHSQVRGRAG